MRFLRFTSVVKWQLRLLVLVLLLLLCPSPGLSVIPRNENLGPEALPQRLSAFHEQRLTRANPNVSKVYRRRLRQDQADGVDHNPDADADTKDTAALTKTTSFAQEAKGADNIPKPNRDDGDNATAANEDAEVDAQMAAIARDAGITEEELNRVEKNQESERSLEDMIRDVDDAVSIIGRAKDNDVEDKLERANRKAELANENNEAPQDDSAVLRAGTKMIETNAGNVDGGAADHNSDEESNVRDARQADQPPHEMVAPGRPNKPLVKHSKSETEESKGRDVVISSLRIENENYRQRIKNLVESERNARHTEREGKLEVERLKKEIEKMRAEKKNADQFVREQKLENKKLRESFSKSVDEAKVERNGEMEEMKATIEEQKRAFEELLEEKRLLSRMLSDEQRKLNELQEKIQHPDLGLWVRQRAERAAILMESPETDAIKYYAQKYMAPKVTKMKHKLQMLESRVERSVDHLLPAKYGWFVAMLLSIGLIGFPVFVTVSTAVSVTKSFSLRQHVLVGNVFLAAFAAGLCIAGVVLRQDPLQTLYEASGSLFIMLQLGMAVAYPAFVIVILCAVLRARDRVDVLVFGCEAVFYAVIGINYRSRVWRGAMLGEHIDTGPMMYVVYLVDFVAMMALTISSSRTQGAVEVGGHDVEEGFEKHGGQSGAGRVGANASRIGVLGKGLGQLSVGRRREEKAE